MSASNGNRIQLSLPSRLELLGVVDKIADGITEYLEFEDVDRDAVAISVIEACTNAIQHGNGQDSGVPVGVTFELDSDQLTILVHDEGKGFHPTPEDAMSPPDLLAVRGRGIFIMRSMMDQVDFDFSNGTTVSLVKRRSKSAEAGTAS
ncbi:MAG TPA: ATP-binding protein [Dongiaceae bacterium]|jgi:serine/threonine-protein kinase RsbW|nr:ATP-binding protein [Dongiaceae bacterium]